MKGERYKICGRCKHHELDTDYKAWYCSNDDSEYWTDFTDYTDYCDEWEYQGLSKEVENDD